MMLFLVILLAQSVQPADPLSGGAGWFGAGLLGLVLGWVFFFHLPAKDKQLKELFEGKDNQVKELIAGFAAEREKDRVTRHEQSEMFQRAIAQICAEFKADMQGERASCERRNDMMAKAIEALANRVNNRT